MLSHATTTGSLFSVLLAVLMFSLSQAGVAAAQGNTSLGTNALPHNMTGNFNTAIGLNTLLSNTTGSQNTASGVNALLSNTTGGQNAASGVNLLGQIPRSLLRLLQWWYGRWHERLATYKAQRLVLALPYRVSGEVSPRHL